MPAVAPVTGTSVAIGATYADPRAACGPDLVPAARGKQFLEAKANRTFRQYCADVGTLITDLTDAADSGRLGTRLRSAASIDRLDRLMHLNVTPVMRLIGAVVPRFLAQGRGAIVNLPLIPARAPEIPVGVYQATKSIVLAFARELGLELGLRVISIQAVLPAGTRIEIWERPGMARIGKSRMMDVRALVDAALPAFDCKEPVTIPPMPGKAQCKASRQARLAMVPNFPQQHPAARYQGAAV